MPTKTKISEHIFDASIIPFSVVATPFSVRTLSSPQVKISRWSFSDSTSAIIMHSHR